MKLTASKDLPALRAAAKARVDEAAEAERARLLTPGAGQALVYADKAVEVAVYDGDPDPRPEAYPLLAAEVGVTVSSLAEAAERVRAARARWKAEAATIEARRLRAKSAVDAATTPAGIDAAATLDGGSVSGGGE